MRECLRLTVAGAVGLILRRRHVEQLTRSRDVLDAPAVGEETIVTDAVETVGQDVDEEAANELVDGERHRLGPLTSIGRTRNRSSFQKPRRIFTLPARHCELKGP